MHFEYLTFGIHHKASGTVKNFATTAARRLIQGPFSSPPFRISLGNGRYTRDVPRA